jgi:sorbitol-specific phosphotransferase system component IIC
MDVSNLPEPEPIARRKDESESEPPQMSEAAAIGNVFIEPGNVFADMRRKPRFLLAGLIVLLSVSAFQIAFIEKIGYKEIVKARIESSKRTQELPADQKAQIIDQQGSSTFKYVTYGATPVVVVVIFLLGGLIYFLGANALGGSAKFFGGVSVWVYSSLPPAIIFLLGNILVLFLKNVDDIDLAHSQGGLLKANLGFFFDPNTSPVLNAFLSAFDIFAIWGWILAAIGLQRVAKISSGAAWAVVLIPAVIGVAFKVIGALFF